VIKRGDGHRHRALDYMPKTCMNPENVENIFTSRNRFSSLFTRLDVGPSGAFVRRW
jgi:hypothetical protein